MDQADSNQTDGVNPDDLAVDHFAPGMIRKIAGWTIRRDEGGGIFAERDRDGRCLLAHGEKLCSPVGRSLLALLTDLLNEAAPEPATVAAVPERPIITTSMKAACMGAFHMAIKVAEVGEDGNATGEIVTQTREMPWEAIKTIYETMYREAIKSGALAVVKQEPPTVAVDALALRTVVTESLMGMITAITGRLPPEGPLPDFIQAPIDRAIERIGRLLEGGE